jgi:NADH-quinone oxidoreductase subunit C
MDADKIANKIRECFKDALLEEQMGLKQPFVRIDKKKIHEIASFLRDDSELKFDFLQCLTGIDRRQNLELVYHFNSYARKHGLVVKTDLAKDKPEIDSISDIYGIANWYEREAFDLLGIIFRGHPELRRILLPDDWQGNPLLKDYEAPLQYRGISHKR